MTRDRRRTLLLAISIVALGGCGAEASLDTSYQDCIGSAEVVVEGWHTIDLDNSEINNGESSASIAGGMPVKLLEYISDDYYGGYYRAEIPHLDQSNYETYGNTPWSSWPADARAIGYVYEGILGNFNDSCAPLVNLCPAGDSDCATIAMVVGPESDDQYQPAAYDYTYSGREYRGATIGGTLSLGPETADYSACDPSDTGCPVLRLPEGTLGSVVGDCPGDAATCTLEINAPATCDSSEADCTPASFQVDVPRQKLQITGRGSHRDTRLCAPGWELLHYARTGGYLEIFSTVESQGEELRGSGHPVIPSLDQPAWLPGGSRVLLLESHADDDDWVQVEFPALKSTDEISLTAWTRRRDLWASNRCEPWGPSQVRLMNSPTRIARAHAFEERFRWDLDGNSTPDLILLDLLGSASNYTGRSQAVAAMNTIDGQRLSAAQSFAMIDRAVCGAEVRSANNEAIALSQRTGASCDGGCPADLTCIGRADVESCQRFDASRSPQPNNGFREVTFLLASLMGQASSPNELDVKPSLSFPAGSPTEAYCYNDEIRDTSVINAHGDGVVVVAGGRLRSMSGYELRAEVQLWRDQSP